MEQNKKIIEQLFNDVISSRKFNLLDQIISPDFVNHGIPNAKSGPEGFKEILQQFFDGFPDMQINVEHITGDGDLVATRGYWTGTNNGPFMGAPPTGKKVRVEYIDFWKVQNGKCMENWVQMDMMGMMQQVGAMHENA